MDRRPRDIPPEDRYGGGQSYRPNAARDRSPPRRYDGRGPPRRSRSPPARDGYRRRSPSPRERFGVPRGGDSYRARPRSPARRDDLGRDDLFRRDARDERNFRDDRGVRDSRDYNGRSPPRFRERSPGRGGSPYRGRRTPPAGPRRDISPARRFDDHPPSRPRSPPRRPTSPRGNRDYPSRPRSPPSRNEPIDRHRPRSPSPRSNRSIRDLDERGRESGATSRKSSPPVHASRLALVQDDDSRPGRPSPRGAGSEGFARQSARSPEPQRYNGSPRKDKNGDHVLPDAAASEPAPAREPYKDDRRPARDPPSGPSADRAPPTGPATATPRTFAPPPAGPRGDSAAVRGGFAPRGRGAYNADFTPPQGRGGAITTTFRGGRGGTPAFSHSASYEREASFSTSTSTPTGPRTSFGTAPRPPVPRTISTSAQSLRSESSFDLPREPRPVLASNTNDAYRRPAAPIAPPSGPASDRTRESRPSDGIHPALRDLPEIVPNGKKIPPVADHTRLNKLEEETERLRKTIQDKEARKRKGLREWDRLVREGESAAFRSDIAEESVRAFDGEGERAGSAF